MKIVSVLDMAEHLLAVQFFETSSLWAMFSLQAVAEHQRVFVVGDIFQGNQVVNGLYEGGSDCVGYDVETAQRNQGVKSAQIDAPPAAGWGLAASWLLWKISRIHALTMPVAAIEVIQALDSHVRIVV